METDEDFVSSNIGAHLTGYAHDPNLTDERRAEARRILSLECAMTLAGTTKMVVKTAREIEAYLRGGAVVADLREVAKRR